MLGVTSSHGQECESTDEIAGKHMRDKCVLLKFHSRHISHNLYRLVYLLSASATVGVGGNGRAIPTLRGAK